MSCRLLSCCSKYSKGTCGKNSVIGDYDLIIGMDIITLGDFVISNKDNQTWFAFRYPSSDHIEF